MSRVMAAALGTGIFCFIWQGIAASVGLPSWLGFVGCTSYFAAGGGMQGALKSMCSNYAGVLWCMLIILSGSINFFPENVSFVAFSMNGGILFGSIVTGFFSWLIVYQSKIDLLALVPNTFMGGFSTFATGGDWKMLLLCLALGNLLGIICDYSGRCMYHWWGEHDTSEG